MADVPTETLTVEWKKVEEAVRRMYTDKGYKIVSIKPRFKIRLEYPKMSTVEEMRQNVSNMFKTTPEDRNQTVQPKAIVDSFTVEVVVEEPQIKEAVT